MADLPTYDDVCPYKIIVAVDYGTTYSGISYVTSNKTSEDIVIVTRWPNHRDQSWKAPSLMAYASENSRVNRDSWGYEVTRSLRSYAWTKLLLDNSVELAKHDDPLLREMYGSEGFMKLPPHKTAQDVVRDFLSEIYKHAVVTLERELSPEIFKTLPMECWITMPAIWSDRAQRLTRDAALGAGFGSRAGDTVNMITEPEAAALWALKPYLDRNSIDPVKPGEHILVCDCGGGTVDLITYEVLVAQPRLQHREVCVGTGAKCGATAIDRKFMQWMEQQFGEAYTSLDIKKRGPGSLFMQAFETEKRSFSGSDTDRHVLEIGPIVLDLDSSSIKYDEDEQFVKVTRTEMQSFFDAPIAELIKKVDEQYAQLAAKKLKLDRFILVGGFGDSPYLNTRLKQWCEKKQVKRFTCPVDCQAAIVKGAALRGLEGTRPTEVVAKKNYGWCWGVHFKEGIHDEKHAYYDSFDGSKMCSGVMHWVVRKGQQLDAEFKVRQNVYFSRDEHTKDIHSDLKLYSCKGDDPPLRVEDLNVRREGTITTRFKSKDEADASKFSHKKGKMLYNYKYTVEVDFRSSEGILGFKSFKGEKEAGTTTIAFDYI